MQRSYLSRVGTSLSQLVNTIILNGDPDESISGRAFREGSLEAHATWFKASKIIDAIFIWEKDHCKNAHEYDVERALEWVTKYAKHQ